MARWQLFGSFLVKALNKEVDFDDTNVKLMLATSSYTPAPDTHDYKDDVTNEVSGTGYTAGGAAVTTPTFAYVPAASATAHATSTAYQLGDIVRPSTSNGHVYICVAAGTSDGSAPTWSTTEGANITDGTVTWLEIGRGYVKLDFDDVTWSSSTITARIAVLYYNTGTASTSPVIAYNDFGEDKSSSSGNFTVGLDATGAIVIPIR